ncbi:DUF1778 domain-containing protein [Plantibacter flavus]|jgi:uncharacterized protein (DUF1778 family)|uniref:type II toxin-antitoxin system TacA family antitoxin n=1 Tax=Plantibacter flavus TaxID=150123 RepID=UPI0023792847|nr:DUF1778 domain-containing protein [Plantibacter flavus]MDD9151220.1 DUF1778 domain-containing protein [Plantibacter flavus]
MASPLKDKRIEVRVTSAQKDAIATAAAIEGRSITDFTTSAATERAADVIRRERDIRVDAAAFEQFEAILERPARSIDGLRDLLNRPTIFVD